MFFISSYFFSYILSYSCLICSIFSTYFLFSSVRILFNSMFLNRSISFFKSSLYLLSSSSLYSKNFFSLDLLKGKTCSIFNNLLYLSSIFLSSFSRFISFFLFFNSSSGNKVCDSLSILFMLL